MEQHKLNFAIQMNNLGKNEEKIILVTKKMKGGIY